MAGVLAARVVQLSDTHLSAREPAPSWWPALQRWLAADPPALIVHTGDVVLEDPDDEADRAFAHRLVGGLGDRVVAVPGNHDVGFYGEDEARPARRAAFRETWGADTFVTDLGGWRLVGADSYRLGDADHDDWLAEAVSDAGPVAVFIHQPLRGDQADGWQMPAAAVAAFERAVAGADVRVVASGHRHCAAVTERDGRRAVWCPSTRYIGNAAGAVGVDPGRGLVEHSFGPYGHYDSRVVRPWLDGDRLGVTLPSEVRT